MLSSLGLIRASESPNNKAAAYPQDPLRHPGVPRHLHYVHQHLVRNNAVARSDGPSASDLDKELVYMYNLYNPVHDGYHVVSSGSR